MYTEDERTFIYIVSNVAKGQEEDQTESPTSFILGQVIGKNVWQGKTATTKPVTAGLFVFLLRSHFSGVSREERSRDWGKVASLG